MIVKKTTPQINIILETQEEIDRFYAIFNSAQINKGLDIDVQVAENNPWRQLFLTLTENRSEQGSVYFRKLIRLLGCND